MQLNEMMAVLCGTADDYCDTQCTRSRHSCKNCNLFLAQIKLSELVCEYKDLKEKEQFMRDPKRIDRIAKKFTYIWKSVPDWRFCQLYVNLFGREDNFYIEDDKIEAILDEIIEKGF